MDMSLERNLYAGNRLYLPDWLYNALPYLYILVGLLTMANLHSAMAILSGLTLIAAGATVWSMRYAYRREQRGHASVTRGHAKPEDELALPAGLVQITWRDGFECGHVLIDTQHRHLFDLGNQLINAVLEWKPKAEVEGILAELVGTIVNHFCTEEALLARCQHRLTLEHQESHRVLLSKAKALQRRYSEDDIDVGALVGFLVYDVITEHILKDDLKFAA